MNIEQGKEPKFKVGDKVRVVAENHRYFKKETEVKIFDIDAYGAYICEGVDVYGTTDMWTVNESDLSPIEEQTNLVAEGSNTDETSVVTPHSSSSNSIGLRETILINGIKNMLRAKNASSLYEDCEQGYITDEDYQKEIEQNESKYVIDIKKVVSKEEFEILAAIVKEVNPDFTVDEVAEIFGLDVSNMLNKELPVQECDASKADSSTFSPDNNSEKTMTSKDHSGIKEGEEIDCYAASLPSLSEAWNSEEDKKRWELEPKEQVSKEESMSDFLNSKGEDDYELMEEQTKIEQQENEWDKEKTEPKEGWKEEFHKWEMEKFSTLTNGHQYLRIGSEEGRDWMEENHVQPLEQQLSKAKQENAALLEDNNTFLKKVSELESENERLRNLLAEAEQK